MEMDDRTRQSVSLVFKHRADGAIQLSNEDAADIAILDMDSENSLNAYRTVRGHKPALRAIGLSSNQHAQAEEVLILPKPLSAGRLLEAIQSMSGMDLALPGVKVAGAASSLSTRIGGRRKTESSTTPSNGMTTFDPQAYLLGTVLEASSEAEKRDALAVVTFYHDRVILVDNKHKIIQTNLTASQTRAFSLSAIKGGESDGMLASFGLHRPVIEYMDREQARKQFAGQTYEVPQESFMWKLGAMTSRGRLPAGMELGHRVYLRRWPNMTLFSYSDNDMRIVAYWAAQAASPNEIAQALDLPVQDVCTVYCAAYATGLAGIARREVDDIWEASAVTEHDQRGLFSSIMRRLVERRPHVGHEELAA